MDIRDWPLLSPANATTARSRPTMSLYCHRCDRYFRNQHAINQHFQYSWSHHECPECNFDGEDYEELKQHYYKTEHRIVCDGCNDGDGANWSNRGAYQRHLIDENVCTECDRHFDTPSNLHYVRLPIYLMISLSNKLWLQHKLLHLDRVHDCNHCNASFKTFAHLILHIDGDHCPGMTSDALNIRAAECDWWEDFMHEDFQHIALNDWRFHLNRHNLDYYPYFCPECDSQFTKLSGLLQHVESPACDQDIESGAIGRLVYELGRPS